MAKALLTGQLQTAAGTAGLLHPALFQVRAQIATMLPSLSGSAAFETERLQRAHRCT